MDLELAGKRAIVTGGSSGIGKAIALELALEGVSVGIAARNQERGARAADELSAASGTEVLALPCDTGDDASVHAMVERFVARHGGVDILVNCAAQVASLMPPSQATTLSATALWEQLNVKVLGYARCAGKVAPFMTRQRWGRIINVGGGYRGGSVVGSIRNVSVTVLTKSLADELGPHGVNVTAVHPGRTRTERERSPQEQDPLNVIGRMIEAREIGWLVAFLASPRSSAVNGESIPCDGGTPKFIRY